MSSMHFYHKHGFHSDSYIISSSSSAINKMLYGRANLVPIAVPRFCFKCLFPKSYFLTLLLRNQQWCQTYFSFRLSSHFLNADIPSSYGMFGYNPAASIAHKIMSSGSFDREWSFFRISLVAFIKVFSA